VTLRNPKILLHVTWVIAPDRVAKGEFIRTNHQHKPNHVTCIVHDEADKRRFMRCITEAIKGVNQSSNLSVT
jgi:hypothetical protein